MYAKYVWAFIKFEPATFTINLAKLEEHFDTITPKNEEIKVEEIKSMLRGVLKGLNAKKKSLGESGSFQDHYDFVVKNGVKIVKGSVQELIHDLNELIHTSEGAASIQEAFKAQLNRDGEIDQKGLRAICEDLGMHTTQAQRMQLFESIDKDKDVLITYEELKEYLDSYNLKLTLKSSILKQVSPRTGILELLTALTNDDKLTEKDFLRPGYKSILTSEHACLIRLEQIVLEMKRNHQEMFFDTDFGPKNDDDIAGHKLALYRDGEYSKFLPRSEGVEWYGPEIYAGKDWKFVDEGASFNEVLQGQLGDCWFIGALSVLAARDELLMGGLDKYESLQNLKITSHVSRRLSEGVYAPIFRGYARYGIFVLRFFKNFKPVYVIVDTRLPCFIGSKSPVFARCRDIKELWVPLIEKAYAKLHG